MCLRLQMQGMAKKYAVRQGNTALESERDA
jgi:hypothetical protein